MGYLVILVGSHGNEFRFREQVCAKCTIRQLQNIIGSDDVEPGLVLMHRVEYGL